MSMYAYLYRVCHAWKIYENSSWEMLKPLKISSHHAGGMMSRWTEPQNFVVLHFKQIAIINFHSLFFILTINVKWKEGFFYRDKIQSGKIKKKILYSLEKRYSSI